MAAVLTALLIGILTGAVLRPFLDSYLCWKTALFYAANTDDPVSELFREPQP